MECMELKRHGRQLSIEEVCRKYEAETTWKLGRTETNLTAERGPPWGQSPHEICHAHAADVQIWIDLGDEQVLIEVARPGNIYTAEYKRICHFVQTAAGYRFIQILRGVIYFSHSFIHRSAQMSCITALVVLGTVAQCLSAFADMKGLASTIWSYTRTAVGDMKSEKLRLEILQIVCRQLRTVPRTHITTPEELRAIEALLDDCGRKLEEIQRKLLDPRQETLATRIRLKEDVNAALEAVASNFTYCSTALDALPRMVNLCSDTREPPSPAEAVVAPHCTDASSRSLNSLSNEGSHVQRDQAPT